MNWWEAQINLGWKGPIGQPRGSEMASFPLRTGVRYRVSMDPAKSHLLVPNRDYAYCGLTLAPDEEWLINWGYDAYYWVVADDRVDGNWCKDCTKWKSKWAGGAKLPFTVDSPITSDEWTLTVGSETIKRKAKLDAMADVVVGWFGQGAERI